MLTGSVCNQTGQVAQESVGSEVMKLAKSVEILAGGVRERVALKLESISIPSCPATENKGNDCRQYPIYFADLQTILFSIQSSLFAIDDNISRTAL